MRVAVAGKGGSGKTTIAGTMSRVLARRGRSVIAIDGDSNPNLALALGVEPSAAATFGGLPPGLARVREDELGNRRLVLAEPVSDILDRYGVDAPDGIRLMVASKIDHAGSG
ncbi:MAG TPA: AAA family ATPase [Actinomycetota bacterium]|nr:AAA family ATPase [Actinomycetota bacterium]